MSQFNSHIRSSVLRTAYCVLGLLRAQRAAHACPTTRATAAGCGARLSVAPLVGQGLSTLNCRAQLTRQKRDDTVFDAFTIQIAGSIRAASDNDRATVQILITDVTDGTHKAKPVLSGISNFEFQISNFPRPVFFYRADLGRIPDKVTTLSDWTTVAHLNIDWLLFPHKGKRVLRFSTSVLSGQTDQELACAECSFTCENPDFGYVDLQENVHRTKTLAVALALAVSAADSRLYHAEVCLIKDWARTNILENSKFKIQNLKFETALDQAVSFFQKGNQLDIYKVCKEIVEIAPLCDRYDILDLCLQVARAKGTVAAGELTALKYIASWLEVDMDRFRTMMEKVLPVNIHQVKDAKVVLGLGCDMSREKTRRQLNREYRKWNSRVTNADPEIQAQADQMLRLIAEARSQYVG